MPAVIIGLRLCMSSVASAAAVAVVNGGGQATISKKTLKKILLGKEKKWEDGSPIVLVMLEGGDTHGTFVKKFAGKSAKQFTNYWRKMVFSGKGKMPKSFASEEELKDIIGNHFIDYKTKNIKEKMTDDEFEKEMKSFLNSDPKENEPEEKGGDETDAEET